MLKMLSTGPALSATLLLSIVIGCSGPDDRVVDVAREAADRQAAQNETIAGQTSQLTEMSSSFLEAEQRARQEVIALQQDLVDRDAQCRQELTALQRETQAAVSSERQEAARQRDLLEAERKQLADQRHRAPIVAAAIAQVGLLLACLAPLVLCGWLIYSLRNSENDDTTMVELLVEELAAGSPVLSLPGPSASEKRRLLSNAKAEPEPAVDAVDES
jgi:hypothetical protein